MGTKRGAYRHKASETTGNARQDKLREQTGLTTAEWKALNQAMDSFLGEGTKPTAHVRRTGPTRTRPSFVRWRVTYSGPSLGLALLAAMARRAIDRAIAEGKVSKPEPQEWIDPWQHIE